MVREKLKVVMAAGEDLVSEIDDQGAKADKSEEFIKTINAEIDAYETKHVPTGAGSH